MYKWLRLAMSNGLRKLKRWVEVKCTLHPLLLLSEMLDCRRPFQQLLQIYSRWETHDLCVRTQKMRQHLSPISVKIQDEIIL